MTSDPKNTSTDAASQTYTRWNLPDVTSSVLLSSAEKEARERQHQRFKKPKKTGPVDVAAGESIEVVETLEDTVKPITADQLQAITDAAEKEGYDVGYEKGNECGYEEGEKNGYSAGLEKANEKINERCERLDRIIEALLIPLESERQQLEILMVDMIRQLTEAVVMREINSDSSQVTKLVDDALSAIPTGSDKFSLYLNAQDIALVKAHLSDQHMDKKFNYYSDDNLLPGGCRLETKNSTVTNTVEQHLNKVIDDFIHKRTVASEEKIQEVKKALDDSLPPDQPAVGNTDKMLTESSTASKLKSKAGVELIDEPKVELEGQPEDESTREDDKALTQSDFSSPSNALSDPQPNLQADRQSISESISESNPQINSRSNEETKVISDFSENNAAKLADSTSSINLTNIGDEAVTTTADPLSGQEHQQALKKTTEPMSALESAQQKRDAQKPQEKNINSDSESHKDSHKDSHIPGDNDARI